MQHGTIIPSARAEVNGHVRSSKPYTIEEITAEWTCKKRDGQVVPFNPGKISEAVTKCFMSLLKEGTLNQEHDCFKHGVRERIVRSVVNSLAAQKVTCPDVEQVQLLVIQQLWSEGLFEAAEHYQSYREQRRRARLAKPISQDVIDRVLEDQKHFPTDLQYYQFMGKFSRWRENDKRRETWHETVHERVMPWFQRLPLVAGKLSEQEWAELTSAMYNLEASPAMRVVQMAGPALDRCHVGVYNCAYQPIEDLFSFSELLYVLMQGTGAGFSVESDYISELPRLKKQKGKKPDTITVPDSTEGWCNSYFEGLQRWWDGHDVNYDVSQVRPVGTRLKTKGGRASGPGPFLELMAFTRNVVMARQGKYLEDTDAHRMACFTGRIVQVGGVRRAATISISDLLSLGMRGIKSGNWYNDTTYWTDGKYLTMANNSAAYEERPSIEVFMREWQALIESKAGERGIYNRQAVIKNRPDRRKKAKFGMNPCAEIVLRPYEFCNLSIVIARSYDTVESLVRKVRIATIFGLMQSTATDFRYIRGEWKKNCEEERLLGVDVTGHADCPLLRFGAPGRAELLRLLKSVVHKTKAEYAPRFGINLSPADTCVKPGGDSGVFFDCASGVSPRFADWTLRWVRESKDSPIAQFLIESGVPHAPAPEAPAELLVFGFPKPAPPGSTKRNDMTAVQQLQNWLEWKKNYAEHSVSCTIYVEDHEWLEAGAWVYRQENWDQLSGLAFLPKDNGTYTYAPNEEVTKEQYDRLTADFPKLNWAKLQHYEQEDNTGTAQTWACTGDKCERY